MERISCLSLCVLIILTLKLILKINFKSAKKLEENNQLKEITNKFPDNNKIAKEMLEMLNNSDVRVEQNQDSKTSLYIGITNKIVISDLKENYGRIGTIAHECIHSIQDRALVLFNFVFSNLVLLYWFCILVLVLFNVIENEMIYFFALLILLFIQTTIRLYLETDAMLKAVGLSDEYVKSKKLCSEDERIELIKQYRIINDMGVKFYIFSLVSKALLKIVFVLLISIC